jgi:hypothetical protein
VNSRKRKKKNAIKRNSLPRFTYHIGIQRRKIRILVDVMNAHQKTVVTDVLIQQESCVLLQLIQQKSLPRGRN